MARQKLKLGELLVKSGRITSFQLESALSHQKMLGGRLGASLIKLGYIKERELLGFLAEQLGLPLVDLSKEEIFPEVLAFLPREKAIELNVLPLKQLKVNGVNCVIMALSDPTNLHLVDSLRFMLGQRILPALALEADISAAIDIFYGIPHEKIAPAEKAITDSVENPSGVRIKALAATEEKFQALLKVLLIKGVINSREYERLR